MTANELADKFNTYDEPHDWGVQAQIMLRQQAQEIAELRKIVEGTIGQAFYEDDYHKARAEIQELKQQLEKERNIYAYALYKKVNEK